MYRGGDFAGAGMGDSFGGAPTENIQGSPVADLSLSNYTGGDPNTTPYDEYGGQWDPGSELTPQEWESRRGGIGSDAVRDRMAWTLAQSSPYATPYQPPSNGPYPNQGYNPGMANWFANPDMRGGWGTSNAPAQQPINPFDGRTNSPTPYFNDFLVPDYSSLMATPYQPGG